MIRDVESESIPESINFGGINIDTNFSGEFGMKVNA